MKKVNAFKMLVEHIDIEHINAIKQFQTKTFSLYLIEINFPCFVFQ